MFQSTRPARGATSAADDARRSHLKFQSTRPARGATAVADRGRAVLDVSIHAPRAGRDPGVLRSAGHAGVSIHAPRAGRDTRSSAESSPRCCFNPRAPRGARPAASLGDRNVPLFQSTRPARGATLHAMQQIVSNGVSIHAPRAGRDLRVAPDHRDGLRFNPRAPRGARPLDAFSARGPVFVSIHAPRAGRDEAHGFLGLFASVSIHAPRAGRDGRRLVRAARRGCFNPRAPRGARPVATIRAKAIAKFQSTRPARGATYVKAAQRSPHKFQSTRPARGATPAVCSASLGEGVSIHAPRAGRDAARTTHL